ncbi:MAG TPA: ankyrin repeat domain-containing protein [Phycisphaerae bacterium]|nr:ankyrin repeat domain-containing protein [Phycisphaerae bacterium]
MRCLRNVGAIAASALFASSLAFIHQDTRAESILPLILSGEYGRVRTIVEANPAALTISDSYGNTPLHLAAAAGQIELVQFFLAHGASPNLRNHHGDTPLAYGLRSPRNQIAIVDALLSAGADPEHCTEVEDQQALIDED